MRFRSSAIIWFALALFTTTASARYIQADPIGLEGGTNVYAYVGGNPVMYSDPTGLIYRCIQPLHAWPGGFNNGVGIFHHAFVCDDKGSNCYGQDWQNSSWWHTPLLAPGRPSEGDKFNEKTCQRIAPNNDCINQCIIKRSANKARPYYSLPPTFGSIAPLAPNCQEFADSEITTCFLECQKK